MQILQLSAASNTGHNDDLTQDVSKLNVRQGKESDSRKEKKTSVGKLPRMSQNAY